MNGDSESAGPIRVRRKVHEAACLLEKQAAALGRNDWDIAQECREGCMAKGDEAGRRFWHEVYEYLFTLTCVAAGTPVEIIDDDKS